MNDLKQKLIEQFDKDGIDLVRFGNAERFRDPAVAKLFPHAGTVIGIAVRQLRGARRGIEEGSTYYQYTTCAVETLEEIILPMALMRACSILEEAGYEALPQRRNQNIMAEDGSTNPEVDSRAIYRGITTETQLNFETCAVDSGLGEIGLSGSLLTEMFGPFQRVAFVITDAIFSPDPIATPHLCDRCGKCIKGCPGHAIDAQGNLNRWQCAAYYIGANRKKNPFMPPATFADDPERMSILSGQADLSAEKAQEIINQIIFYPPAKHSYWTCICGKACDTECYIHLEEEGKLTKKFDTPFRKRPVWELSLDDENET